LQSTAAPRSKEAAWSPGVLQKETDRHSSEGTSDDQATVNRAKKAMAEL